MVRRTFWIGALEDAWRHRTLIWLVGVRRAGKTCLARSVPGCRYFDCELPSVRRVLHDPEYFLDRHKGGTVILDEVHRLQNPSEILKIAADHYPTTRVLATGSSVLGASAKFRDTLAGRKVEVWLTPMNSRDAADFGNVDLRRRLLHGGLPPFFQAQRIPERDFQEWIDAYWAKDIQELFRVEKRHSFQKFAELIFAQSGGIFEASSFAAPCEVSRTTITTYLSVLEATRVAHVIRPFSSRRATEIITAPRVYAFDTGFVCYYRGWNRLRPDDLGSLWEHVVLNEIHSRLPGSAVHYWRDKQHHEIDFVFVQRRATAPVAIECKWSADAFDPANLAVFRRIYPHGLNLVVAADVRQNFRRTMKGQRVQFVSLDGLIARLDHLRSSSTRARS